MKLSKKREKLKARGADKCRNFKKTRLKRSNENSKKQNDFLKKKTKKLE